MSGFGASYWSQTRGAGSSGLWYQLLEGVEGLSSSYWSVWLTATEVGMVCVLKNQLLGGISASEVSEGFSTGF